MRKLLNTTGASQLAFIPCKSGQADVRAFEESVGSGIPDRLRKTLSGDAEAVRELVGSVLGPAGAFLHRVASLPLLGIVAPQEGGRYGRTYWWYLALSWRHARDGFIAARLSHLRADSQELRDVPTVYARLLAVFDQILLDPFGVSQGFIGPVGGVGLGGFEQEMANVRCSRDAVLAGSGSPLDHDSRASVELSSLLPILNDGLGNCYLVERCSSGLALAFFDHETGALGESDSTIEDLVSTFWERPERYL